MKTDYIDMHIHILPGVDDGARNLQETRDMLIAAYNEGVSTIVATPHCSIDGKAVERAEKIRTAYLQTCRLCMEIAEETGEEPMKLFLGSEIYCSTAAAGGIPEMIRRGDAFSINNGRYVLIETSFTITYGEMFKIIRQLEKSGFIPVLAHVERYDSLFGKWEHIDELIENGVIIQMNAESLAPPKRFSDRFSKIRKWCWQLMEQDSVHLVCSDAHRIDRGNCMAEAMESIRKKLGPEKVMELTQNADRVLNNVAIK